MDTVAGAKPTATESPGAREGMIDDPSARSSSDVGGSGSAEIDGGNRSNSGSGGAENTDNGGAGQLQRLEANRLKWTISPLNLSLSRTRGETRRLAEADSFPSTMTFGRCSAVLGRRGGANRKIRKWTTLTPNCSRSSVTCNKKAAATG